MQVRELRMLVNKPPDMLVCVRHPCMHIFLVGFVVRGAEHGADQSAQHAYEM